MRLNRFKQSIVGGGVYDGLLGR
ncbi:MAG: hypothetical protein GY771_09265 [bacterium]|nr:hypothetical protein [bacterium]